MLLKAKPVVEVIEQENKALSEKISSDCLNLAIIKVGDSDSNDGYLNSIIKQCNKHNIGYQIHVFPVKATSNKDIAETICNINGNFRIAGCLLMQPFPENDFNVDYLQQYIGSRKDIDGITDHSILSVLKDSNPNFAPCTAEACIRILKHYKIPLDGAHVVIVGRSMVVGKPVAMLLDKENATVTLCNSHTKNLQEITKSADIVIAALGKKNFLTKDYFSPHQTVIDVGFHCDKVGISGDVDKEVADYVKNITPVPGGVGSVTTAILINHLYKAANKRLIKSVEE